MSKKIIVAFAGIMAVSLAVAFLGGMGIMIGALPLGIIIFGVLAMMVWDFFDTTRTSFRNGNGNGNGNDATET
ncbi:MAG: hypothetical protein HN403_08400 [Rhodospirillales bacterium]|jgi:hypothetical protein|nr:hypothetical protein [Rhodospirillales bacterium]